MFAFGLMAAFTRAAEAPILAVAAWRAGLVALIFVIWTVLTQGFAALRVDRATLRWAVPLGIAQAVASSTFVGGYAFTTVANTIFLHNLAPAFVFLMAWWLFRERPGSASLTGAGIAFFGVAMLSGVSLFQTTHFADPRFLLGDSLAFVSAIAYAAVLVLTRATRTAQTPLLPTLSISWIVAALGLFIVAAIGGDVLVSPGSLGWIFLLAVISTVLPFYLLNLAMRELPAGAVAVLALFEVVFATLTGMILFGEQLAPIGWIGGLLVGLGILYAIMPEKPDADTVALSDEARRSRAGRLGLALVLLNGGAIAHLLLGSPIGMLLAWAGILQLARLGPWVAAAWVGRFRRVFAVFGALLAAAVMAGLSSRTSWSVAHTDLLALVLGGGVLLGDIWLARQEDDRQRVLEDPVRFSLLALLLAQAMSLIDHPFAGTVTALATLLLALAALPPLIAGLSGRDGAQTPLFPRLIEPLTPGRIAGALALLWIAGGLRTVPIGHAGVVTRFGAPREAVLPPGLSLRLPPPIEAVMVVNVEGIRRVNLITPDTPLLCGDQAMVSLEAVLHYKVADPITFTYTPADPDTALRMLARAALVEATAHRSADTLLTEGRGELEEAVTAATQAAVAELGIAVVSLHISAAAVPAPVLPAFLDVISASEERQERINQAQAYAADVLPKAGGEATALGSAAYADSLDTITRGLSDKAFFDALVYGASVAPGPTRTRLYWEKVEAAAEPHKLIVVPAGMEVWMNGQPQSAETIDRKTSERKKR